ncbi:MAG: hypothetical protein V2J25_13510 [Desulfatiglans sp.]|jgi:hypothetical protein|nr:hypothetical protein [Thermodesulfobacteriota bacterium]MEE4353872.1 hypothetical protein [Desulfatiglans sp.]
MKRKHFATLTLIIVLIFVLVAGFDFVRRTQEGRESRQISPLKLPASTTMPGPEDLKRMEQVAPVMARLAYPSKQDDSPVHLGPFGHHTPLRMNRQGSSDDRMTVAPVMDYALTFTFLADKKRFCIINGRFVAEGASLLDGGTVKQIDRDRVLIEKQKVAKWVLLDTAGRISDKNTKRAGEEM